MASHGHLFRHDLDISTLLWFAKKHIKTDGDLEASRSCFVAAASGRDTSLSEVSKITCIQLQIIFCFPMNVQFVGTPLKGLLFP
jgi:hypothetical protein